MGGALRGGFTWRRTALDAPLLACAGAVLVQWLVGNRRLVAWALGPPAESEIVPWSPLLVGSVAPAQTLSSLVLFLAYAAVYVLVVHHVRRRRDLTRLVLVLLTTGGVLAFAGLLDYLSGESWIFLWRQEPLRGRLAASFVNPDHLATWLAMLSCLGAGYVMAVRSRDPVRLREMLESRELREEALKRVLPFVAIGLMVLALVFTLSRGAIVALLAGLVALVGLLRAGHRVRSSLTVVSAVAGVALAYSAWIGLAPLVAHVGTSGIGLEHRLAQYRASLPMIADFPVLGVGLGAYRAIYARYQPLAHQPGAVYYPYAHNDPLQFVIEVGLVGLAVLVWAAWRVGRDLVGAHCFGRGACPVGAGAGEAAQRHDPYTLGVAMGALAGIVALLVHACVDFPLRIPANGFLAAALLGIATAALHTRFGAREGLLLSDRREIVMPAGLGYGVVAVTGVLTVALGAYAVRAALVDDRVAAYRAAPTPARAAAIVAIDGADPRGLAARGLARFEESLGLSARADSRPQAGALLDAAIADLRHALHAMPLEPTYHERLASAYVARAFAGGDRRDAAHALAHYRRAIAAAPENGRLYLSLFRFALSQRAELLDVALGAGRAAIARQPEALERILDEAAPLALKDEQWLALAPPAAPARLRLALGLEKRALPSPAVPVARAALDGATPAEADVARWLLTRLLIVQGNVDAAAQEISLALLRNARNAELLLTYAETLRARGDPRALDAFRAAAAAEATPDPFPVRDPALREAIRVRVGPSPVRYRRALARYLDARGFRDQALNEWRAVVDAEDRDAPARAALAAALEAVGQGDRALEEYRRAVALDGRPAFRAALARRLWDRHQYFQAIAEWRAILDANPRDAEARLALARALVKVGERGAAASEYQALLQLDPESKAARVELERAQRGR